VSVTKAVMHTFTVVVHHHGSPACRDTRHETSCPKRGLWLGCDLIGGSLRRGGGGKGTIDTRVYACTHLMPR
jgi:hypothetical protein